VIPAGRHSIVNGIFFPGNRCRTLSGATAVADQLNSFFREYGGVWEWGRGVVERQWKEAGLPLGPDSRWRTV
jgi:hypothetical protein